MWLPKTSTLLRLEALHVYVLLLHVHELALLLTKVALHRSSAQCVHQIPEAVGVLTIRFRGRTLPPFLLWVFPYHHLRPTSGPLLLLLLLASWAAPDSFPSPMVESNTGAPVLLVFGRIPTSPRVSRQSALGSRVTWLEASPSSQDSRHDSVRCRSSLRSSVTTRWSVAWPLSLPHPTPARRFF